jgi:transposase
MAGTVFSRSRIALQVWFYAMLYFADSSEGIANPFLARQLGVSEPTAFRVSQRIRAHMAALDEGQLLGGVGETVMIRLTTVLRISNPCKHVRNSAKVLMLSDSRRVNSTVVVRPRQQSLRAVIGRKVDPRSHLVTDCYWTFRVLENYSSGNPIAAFVPQHFSDRPAHENLNHGFLQYLNMSFADQFTGVTLEKSWLYFKEYEFRYNRRSRSAQTFWDMVTSFPEISQEAIDQMRSRHLVTG